MSVRQLVVIRTKPATEPRAAVQFEGPSAGAGTSNADTREQPADPTMFYKQPGYSPYASRNYADRLYFGDEHPQSIVGRCRWQRRKRWVPRKSTRSARDEHIASTKERAETRNQE